MFAYSIVNSCIGKICLITNGDGLCHLVIQLHENIMENAINLVQSQNLHATLEENDQELFPYTVQLQEYFQGQRKIFDMPLCFTGTPFQKRVWQELRTIPYGNVYTYKQIASLIGSPKAIRAVGGANNRNPLPIVVPCHRVLGSNGSLVGYRTGLEVKKKLLDIEGIRYS